MRWDGQQKEEIANAFPHEVEVCGNQRDAFPWLPSWSTLGGMSSMMSYIFGLTFGGPNFLQIGFLWTIGKVFK